MWFKDGDLNGFQDIRTCGGGWAYARGTLGHWIRLIRRNKKIYGLGAGN